MRYIDKTYRIWRLYVRVVVVDLFEHNKTDNGVVNPLFYIGLMRTFNVKTYSLSLTIPWVKITAGVKL